MLQIIGKGGLAREVAAYAMTQLQIEIRHFEYECEGMIAGSNYPVIIAIGDGAIRKEMFSKFNNYIFDSFNFGNTYKGTRVSIGCVICPGTIVTTNVFLGKFVFINLNCTIGHDCVIRDYVTLHPGVNMSGGCTIGNLVTIGSNAVIREKITICDNVTIGAGSVVVKDILEPGVYLGCPAKKIK